MEKSWNLNHWSWNFLAQGISFVRCTDKVDKKRKGVVDEIEELKQKKQRLHKDADVLLKSADDLADKAEKSHSVTLITKSNSLRRAAKEKSAEIEVVEKQLDAKLLELKNMQQ